MSKLTVPMPKVLGKGGFITSYRGERRECALQYLAVATCLGDKELLLNRISIQHWNSFMYDNDRARTMKARLAAFRRNCSWAGIEIVEGEK